MSCKHGKWDPCDECIEEDANWERGRQAGIVQGNKLRLLLLECDAALSMLSDMPPVNALRAEIAKALANAGENV